MSGTTPAAAAAASAAAASAAAASAAAAAASAPSAVAPSHVVAAPAAAAAAASASGPGGGGAAAAAAAATTASHAVAHAVAHTVDTDTFHPREDATAGGGAGSGPLLSIGDAARDTLGVARLDVSTGGTVSMDALGPLIVNENGTLSRIANWALLSEREQAVAARRVVARNKERIAKLAAAGAPLATVAEGDDDGEGGGGGGAGAGGGGV